MVAKVLLKNWLWRNSDQVRGKQNDLIKKSLDQFPILYNLWHVEGRQDEDTKVEDLEELGQAHVIVDYLAKSILASKTQDHLRLSWEFTGSGNTMI